MKPPRTDDFGRELPRYGSWIYTYSGRVVQPHGPSTSSIAFEDIAHHLSNIGRYTGATRPPTWGRWWRKLLRKVWNPTGIYTVAQHSVLVAEWLEEGGFAHHKVVEGFMHDWHEYAVGDMSAPMKHAVRDFKIYESQFERVLRNKFLGYNKFHWTVKWADLVLATTEWRDMMPAGADLWVKHVAPWERRIEPWPPWYAKRKFIEKARKLGLIGENDG